MYEYNISKRFLTYDIFKHLFHSAHTTCILCLILAVICYFWSLVLLFLLQYCPEGFALLRDNLTAIIIPRNLFYPKRTFTEGRTGALSELSVGTPILLCGFLSGLLLRLLQFWRAERWPAQEANVFSATQVLMSYGVKNTACNTRKTSSTYAITVLLTVRGFLLTWSDFVPASVSWFPCR